MTAMSATMMATQISRLTVKATPTLPSPYRRLLPPLDELDQPEDEEDSEGPEGRTAEDEPRMAVPDEETDDRDDEPMLALG